MDWQRGELAKNVNGNDGKVLLTQHPVNGPLSCQELFVQLNYSRQKYGIEQEEPSGLQNHRLSKPAKHQPVHATL